MPGKDYETDGDDVDDDDTCSYADLYAVIEKRVEAKPTRTFTKEQQDKEDQHRRVPGSELQSYQVQGVRSSIQSRLNFSRKSVPQLPSVEKHHQQLPIVPNQRQLYQMIQLPSVEKPKLELQQNDQPRPVSPQIDLLQSEALGKRQDVNNTLGPKTDASAIENENKEFGKASPEVSTEEGKASEYREYERCLPNDPTIRTTRTSITMKGRSSQSIDRSESCRLRSTEPAQRLTSKSMDRSESSSQRNVQHMSHPRNAQSPSARHKASETSKQTARGRSVSPSTHTSMAYSTSQGKSRRRSQSPSMTIRHRRTSDVGQGVAQSPCPLSSCSEGTDISARKSRRHSLNSLEQGKVHGVTQQSSRRSQSPSLQEKQNSALTHSRQSVVCSDTVVTSSRPSRRNSQSPSARSKAYGAATLQSRRRSQSPSMKESTKSSLANTRHNALSSTSEGMNETTRSSRRHSQSPSARNKAYAATYQSRRRSQSPSIKKTRKSSALVNSSHNTLSSSSEGTNESARSSRRHSQSPSARSRAYAATHQSRRRSQSPSVKESRKSALMTSRNKAVSSSSEGATTKSISLSRRHSQSPSARSKAYAATHASRRRSQSPSMRKSTLIDCHQNTLGSTSDGWNESARSSRRHSQSPSARSKAYAATHQSRRRSQSPSLEMKSKSVQSESRTRKSSDVQTLKCTSQQKRQSQSPTAREKASYAGSEVYHKAIAVESTDVALGRCKDQEKANDTQNESRRPSSQRVEETSDKEKTSASQKTGRYRSLSPMVKRELLSRHVESHRQNSSPEGTRSKRSNRDIAHDQVTAAPRTPKRLPPSHNKLLSEIRSLPQKSPNTSVPRTPSSSVSPGYLAQLFSPTQTVETRKSLPARHAVAGQ